MKKVIVYAVAASMIFSNHACNKENTPKDIPPANPIELTVKQDEKTDADNRFAFKHLQGSFKREWRQYVFLATEPQYGPGNVV